MREFAIPGTLILLPGLAADAELYAPQREAFAESLLLPEWIEPEDENESLGHYAQRWGESIRPLIHMHQQDHPGPIVLGGIAFGAMVALDMASGIGADAVAMISGCLTPDELPSRFVLAQKLGSLTPTSTWPALLSALAIPFAFMDGLGDDDTALLRRLANRINPQILKWASGAVVDWAGPMDPDAMPPVYRAHGLHDWVIPCPESGVDLVIPTGKHLIHLSHEPTVNGFLESCVERHAMPAGA